MQTVDAVMLGRAAYHNPEILAEVDARLYGGDQADTSIADIIDEMCAYTDRHIATGGRLSHVSRHMVGFLPDSRARGAGGKSFRQTPPGRAQTATCCVRPMPS